MHRKITTLLGLAALAGVGAVPAATAATSAQPQPEPYKPVKRSEVGSTTTYVTASGRTAELTCMFSDDPDLASECGETAGDGDGMLNAFKRRNAVRAYTRTFTADGTKSRVLTDFVVLDRGRKLLIQAVGVDNATVVCKLDGGCGQVRQRANKAKLVEELADENKLTTRLKASLQGEDPFLLG